MESGFCPVCKMVKLERKRFPGMRMSESVPYCLYCELYFFKEGVKVLPRRHLEAKLRRSQHGSARR